MKIAIILGVFPALSESFILNQITGLIDLGHEVDIYARVPRKDPTIHPKVLEYNLLDKTTYIREPYTIAKKGWELVKWAVDRPNPRLLRLFNPKYEEARSLQLFFAGKDFVGKQYDVIHCHYGPNGNLMALLKKLKFIDSKIVTTFHGYDIWSEEIKANKSKCYKELKEFGDHYIAISDSVAETLEKEFLFNKEKITVIRNGIDLNNFQFQPRNFSASFKILTVSRLSPEKGIEDALFLIHDLVMDGITNIEYHIVGAGESLKALKRLASILKIEEKVIFHGGKSHADIPKYMKEANLLLLPSKIEVLPMVILEAQASGLPVLAKNVGSVKEVVSPKTGYLANNSQELYNHTINIMQNYSMTRKITQDAQQQIWDLYDIIKTVKKLESLYREFGSL